MEQLQDTALHGFSVHAVHQVLQLLLEAEDGGVAYLLCLFPGGGAGCHPQGGFQAIVAGGGIGQGQIIVEDIPVQLIHNGAVGQPEAVDPMAYGTQAEKTRQVGKGVSCRHGVEGIGSGGKHENALSTRGDAKAAVHPVGGGKGLGIAWNGPQGLQLLGHGQLSGFDKAENSFLDNGIFHEGNVQGFKNRLLCAGYTVLTKGADGDNHIAALQTVDEAAPQGSGIPRFYKIGVAGKAKLHEKAAHVAYYIRIRSLVGGNLDDFCFRHSFPPDLYNKLNVLD